MVGHLLMVGALLEPSIAKGPDDSTVRKITEGLEQSQARRPILDGALLAETR